MNTTIETKSLDKEESKSTKKTIAIVGAGQAGLQLGMSLLALVILQMAFLRGVFALVEEDELAGTGEEDDKEYSYCQEPGVAGAEHGEGEEGEDEWDEDDDAHLEKGLRESMEWRGSPGCLVGGEVPFPALERLRGERAGGAAGREGVVGGPIAEDALLRDVIVFWVAGEADDCGSGDFFKAEGLRGLGIERERCGWECGRTQQVMALRPLIQRIHATMGSMVRRASQERACRVVMRLGLT